MYKRDPRKQGLQQYGFTGPAQMQPIQGMAPPPASPVQPSMVDQAKGMVANKALNVGIGKAEAMAKPYIDKGMAYGANKLGTLMGTNQAATAGTAAMENAALGAAAEGGMGAMMSGMGTAMPYVGMGLLAGKALGLFSQGGYVGPLAKATYAANGEKIGLEFLNAYNSEDMSKLSPLTKASIRRQSVEQASKLNPEDRAKFVDNLRARGITPDTMYGDNNQSTSILEQLFGIK